MRNKISSCVTRLTQTYMNKNLIYHNSEDRINDEGTSDMHPLSNSITKELTNRFSNIIFNQTTDNSIIINQIINTISTFLSNNNYDDKWDIKNDKEFKDDLIEIITTENRIMNCENCRALMGSCDIIS